MERKAYPTDVSDAEWAFVAPYLTLMTEDAPQRDFPLREVSGGLHRIVRNGSSWRHCRQPREALSCYHADGWWSEVSDGCRGFAAWLVTMSHYLKR